MIEKLRMTGSHAETLKRHLYPGDGKESAALAICECATLGKHRILLVREIITIPDEDCSERTELCVVWPTETYLLPRIEQLEVQNQCLLAIHSHPTGFSDFSSTDDIADRQLFNSLYDCLDGHGYHGSAIMLPDGEILARTIDVTGTFHPIPKVVIAGDRISIFEHDTRETWRKEHAAKNLQVFGKGTIATLSNLRVGLAGLSGTGAPTAELLLRHGIGHQVVVDRDYIDNGNLNRISFARVSDAMAQVKKVVRYKEWVAEVGMNTEVTPIIGELETEEALNALAFCDVIFGCVDNAEARHFLNILCSAYLIPFFDLGVHIGTEASRPGEITQALAKVHYVQPDKECLLDRGAYTANELAAESHKRTDPAYYEQQRVAGYLAAVDEGQPAVMVLTSNAANMAVDDLLARLHGYRLDPDNEFDEQERSLTHGYYQCFSHSGPNKALKRFIGLGDKIRKWLL